MAYSIPQAGRMQVASDRYLQEAGARVASPDGTRRPLRPMLLSIATNSERLYAEGESDRLLVSPRWSNRNIAAPPVTPSRSKLWRSEKLASFSSTAQCCSRQSCARQSCLCSGHVNGRLQQSCLSYFLGSSATSIWRSFNWRSSTGAGAPVSISAAF